jgi:hypothetical protein
MIVVTRIGQSLELSVEVVVKQNSPGHCKIMDLKTYGAKSIFSDKQNFPLGQYI